MRIEQRDKYSTPNPDELAALSARGDYMPDSLVGTGFGEAMSGTEMDLQEFLEDKVYRGHWGVFEHPQASFFVEGISRVAMAQVTRHRHMSFDVQSQRYVNFEDKEPVIPPSFEETDGGTFPMGGTESDVAVGPSANKTWADMLRYHWNLSVERYKAALEAGIPKEDARFILPQATPVNMTMSANPRALFHFLDLRDSGAAQWEAQQFAQQIADVASDWAPKSFAAYRNKSNNNSLRAP